MANEVVKYHNDLNTVRIRTWTDAEQNFFFGIVAKARNNGSNELVFDKNDLTELAKYCDKHNERFEKTIENLVIKLAELKYIERSSRQLRVMNLFSLFEVNWASDLTEMNVKIRTSEEFNYVLNKLQAEFTVWELEEFVNIKTSYAKAMFRLLKQWRTQGYKEFSIVEFRQLLDIPKSYKTSHIPQKVLAPISKELSPYFANFKITPLKAKTRGNPVTGYKFTWKAETTGDWKDFEQLKKQDKKKPVRTESVPEDIRLAEKEDEEKKKKLQEDFFQKAMQLRNQSFEDQAELFSEAREVDTYRMPNATQFLDTIASLMAFDLETYWAQVVNDSLTEGEPIG